MDFSDYTTFKTGVRLVPQSPSRKFSVSVRQANGHLDTNKKEGYESSIVI